ncbi:MAG TPA: CRISPR-associated protein Csx19 [Ktedonobacteraceae bacterium]|jgi:CRISPR-associated protein (TIGR03984 family)
MTRNIFDVPTFCKRIETKDVAKGLGDWLSQQMQAYRLKYLLAHAHNGVIWGRLDDDGLHTAHEVAPEDVAPLAVDMLQTARLFGPAGELLIWRGEEDGAWTGRLITETKQEGASPVWEQAFEEQQVVWGTRAEPRARDFTLMREGTQGLLHVVPLSVNQEVDEEHRPLHLVVRHYVKADAGGFLRVAASRLYDLRLHAKEKSNS